MKKIILTLICSAVALLSNIAMANNSHIPTQLSQLTNKTSDSLTCEPSKLTQDSTSISFDGKSAQTIATTFKPDLRCSNSHGSINFIYQMQNKTRSNISGTTADTNWIALDDAGNAAPKTNYKCLFGTNKYGQLVPSCTILKLTPASQPVLPKIQLTQITNQSRYAITCTIPPHSKKIFTAPSNQEIIAEYSPYIFCQAISTTGIDMNDFMLVHAKTGWEAINNISQQVFPSADIDCDQSQCTIKGFDTTKNVKKNPSKWITIPMPAIDDIHIKHTRPKGSGYNWQASTTATTSTGEKVTLHWASKVPYINQKKKHKRGGGYVIQYEGATNPVTNFEITYLKNKEYKAENITGVTDLNTDDWIKLSKTCDSISQAIQKPALKILLKACTLGGQKLTEETPPPFDANTKQKLICSCDLPSTGAA